MIKATILLTVMTTLTGVYLYDSEFVDQSNKKSIEEYRSLAQLFNVIENSEEFTLSNDYLISNDILPQHYREYSVNYDIKTYSKAIVNVGSTNDSYYIEYTNLEPKVCYNLMKLAETDIYAYEDNVNGYQEIDSIMFEQNKYKDLCRTKYGNILHMTYRVPFIRLYFKV